MSNKKYASLESLGSFLTKCRTTFASITHKHTLNDIADYTVDGTLSNDSANPVQNTVITTKFDEIDNAVAHKVQIITWGADD